MASRSTFPTAIDDFWDHTEISVNEIAALKRYQELKLKTRTPSENDELAQLTVTLREKLVTAEDFNKLQDAISATQVFFRDNVDGFVITKQNEINTYVDSKKSEIQNTQDSAQSIIQTTKDSAIADIKSQKASIIEYMDGATAGQIRNDLGFMGDLTTLDSSSLVNALNEINKKVKDLEVFNGMGGF